MDGWMRARRWLFGAALAGGMALATAGAAAQSDACRALIERSLAELSGNCAQAPAGVACYGNDFVAATFAAASEFFHPGAQADYADLLSLRGSPANASTGDWGIAQLNIPADLGDSAAIAEQTGLTLLLLGEAELGELRLPPASQPPALHFRAEIPAELPAESCPAAANLLILHSARSLLTRALVNGVLLDFDGSLIAHQPAANIITFIVADGQLVSQSLTAEAGEALSILLADDGRAQAYIPTRAANESELALVELAQLAQAALRGEIAPPPSATPTPAATATATPPPTTAATTAPAATAASDETATTEAGVAETACQAGEVIRHTVARGETLFAIAQAYQSRVSDIVARNEIEDIHLIHAGAELEVPCQSRQPGQSVIGVPVASAGAQECAGISLYAQLAGENARTFHWTAVEGAERYTVSLWESGVEMTRFESAGAVTSLTGTLPASGASSLQWNVSAWRGEERICASAARALETATETTAPVGAPEYAWQCRASGEIVFSWRNVPAATESLKLSYHNRGGNLIVTLSLPGAAGQAVLAETYAGHGEVALAPQGGSAALSPLEVECE